MSMLNHLGFYLLISVLLFSCNKDEDDRCKSKKKLIACTKEYMPVCGCNNITYSNKCVAESEGINRWVRGKCNN